MLNLNQLESEKKLLEVLASRGVIFSYFGILKHINQLTLERNLLVTFKPDHTDQKV